MNLAYVRIGIAGLPRLALGGTARNLAPVAGKSFCEVVERGDDSMADGLMMMPWFPRDFRSSTLGWPLEARAVYRELLDAQWDLGDLPEDPERLRMIAGASPDQWAIAWPLVAPKLPLNCSGRKNPKLEQHRDKALDLSRKRAEMGRTAGLASAAARSTNRQRSVEPSVNHPSPSPSPIQSNPQNTTAATRPTRADPPEFLRFKQTYPARAGSQPWNRALKVITARLGEGHSWAEIVAGAERYAEFIVASGRLNTEFTMQAATFCGPDKHFLQPWSLPQLPQKPKPVRTWRPEDDEEEINAQR